MMIRTRCAPTSRRILHQKDPDSSLLKLDSGKCMAGIHYCRITPEGAVTPCPYMQVTAGNIKETAFNDLWQNSDEFSNLRNPALKGKCGRCEYKKLCGGCRARAIGKSGDIMDQDPWCAYIPAETEVIEPPVFTIKSDTTDSPSRIKPPWTDDAEARLKRIPFFVRAMVKGAVEKFALDNNHTKITPEVMAEARKNYALGRMSKP
ncbi:SPASM domain-containing protein [bacterium]|nr:SPASM domain-containing protein [bacterium]